MPDFVMWLWGLTGSFKSTLAALGLSHFGAFSETTLPLTFESTANALERSLFLLKDTAAVVDDWRPAVSRSDASEMDKKAQRLLRAAGNRQGRGRMTSDTTLRRSYPPRGLVIATAEALPEGPAFESAAARALSINVVREEVNMQALSELQSNKYALARAMAGYIGWLATRHEDLARELPSHRDGLREEFRSELTDAHPRTPDVLAALIIGLELLRDYAMSLGALDQYSAKEFLARSTAGVLSAAKAHAEVTRGGDPATRFMELMCSLFSAGKAYAKNRESGKQPHRWEELGWEKTEDSFGDDVYQPKRGAEFVGWADDKCLYLDREMAYAAVAGFAHRCGIPFGIKPRVLWEALKRAEISLTDSERTDTTARVEAKVKRVIQVPRAMICGDEES